VRNRLNSLSASADFVGYWTYTTLVGADGVVKTIERLDDPAKTARFVEFADLEKCVGRWRFVKPGRYRMAFHGGTMSHHWTVIISTQNESMRERFARH
jgi:hypothetical protein